MTDASVSQRYRLIGELRDETDADLGELRVPLEVALQKQSVGTVELVGVTAPEPGLIRVELLMIAGSWQQAADLGRDVMTNGFAEAGVEISSAGAPQTHPAERHLERAGTQLLLA